MLDFHSIFTNIFPEYLVSFQQMNKIIHERLQPLEYLSNGEEIFQFWVNYPIKMNKYHSKRVADFWLSCIN